MLVNCFQNQSDFLSKHFYFSNLVSVEGRDLVEKLLTKDPSKRISAKKALGHPWITRRALRMQNPIPQEDQNDQTEDVNNCACTIS